MAMFAFWRRAFCGVLICLTLLPPARALDTAFLWQGELRDTGVPATGSYDFEFRLFGAASGGTQLGPTQTLAAQLVDNGVFSAALNFGDQYDGTPRWLEIAVRRNGQPSFVVLNPRQPLAAAPYALHADSVADNSIIGANIVDGSIASNDIKVGAIDSTLILNGTITSADLGDASVTSAKLADGAVTAGKIANNAVNANHIANGAVGTPQLADGAVTGAKLAAGAVGSAQIDGAQVQRRITDTCPPELGIVGASQNGEPLCGSASNLLVADSAIRPRLALRSDDRPVLIYVDTTTADLIFASCGDPACASATTRVLDTNVGDNVGSIDLALRADGTPFIVYYDQAVGDLHAFDCNDVTCDSATFRSLDATANSGYGASVALRPGDVPIVSYVRGGQLYAYDCDNSDCSSGVARQLDASNIGGSITAIATSSTGLPIVFYEGSGVDAGLNVFICTNNDCSTGTIVDVNDLDIDGLDAAMRSNNAAVASFREIGGIEHVWVYACAGGVGVCGSGTAEQIAFDSLEGRSGIALEDDNTPVVAFAGVNLFGPDLLQVVDCGSSDCVSADTHTPDLVEGRGISPSIAVRDDGRPVLAYEDNGHIRVWVCGNVGCAP